MPIGLIGHGPQPSHLRSDALGTGLGVRKVTIEELLGRPLSKVEKANAPKSVYVAGRLEIPLKGYLVAVVGTRTPMWVEKAKAITAALVDQGYVIVSGLARGIDTIAHTTAILKGGKTIAVLPCPLDRFYPPSNRGLQLRIMREHLAISQFPLGAEIAVGNFPKRNRTMALISHAMVMVEARSGGGTMIAGWEAIRLRRPLLIYGGLSHHPWVQEMKKSGALLFRTEDELLELLKRVLTAEWR